MIEIWMLVFVLTLNDGSLKQLDPSFLSTELECIGMGHKVMAQVPQMRKFVCIPGIFTPYNPEEQS